MLRRGDNTISGTSPALSAAGVDKVPGGSAGGREKTGAGATPRGNAGSNGGGARPGEEAEGAGDAEFPGIGAIGRGAGDNGGGVGGAVHRVPYSSAMGWGSNSIRSMS